MITISTKEKESTIRVKEKTKKMLESLTIGKESHDQTIQRLVKLINQMSSDQGTQITIQGRVSGTKYERTHKEFTIAYEKDSYDVVCTFNDLAIINMIRHNGLLKEKYGGKVPEWELDLELVNIRKNHEAWQNPTRVAAEMRKVLYFACLKAVLEETFDLTIYEITSERELLNTDKWEEIYKRNNLSMDSLEEDVYHAKKRLRIEN